MMTMDNDGSNYEDDDKEDKEGVKIPKNPYPSVWQCLPIASQANSMSDIGDVVINPGMDKCGYISVLTGLQDMGLIHEVKTALAFCNQLAEYMKSFVEEMTAKNKNYLFGIKTRQKSFEKCPSLFIKATANSNERWPFSTWMNTASNDKFSFVCFSENFAITFI